MTYVVTRLCQGCKDTACLTVCPVDCFYEPQEPSPDKPDMLYINPDECIEIIHNAMRHYYFNILTTTFNFGGIPHEEIKKSMKLFAREVMPAFR